MSWTANWNFCKEYVLLKAHGQIFLLDINDIYERFREFYNYLLKYCSIIYFIYLWIFSVLSEIYWHHGLWEKCAGMRLRRSWKRHCVFAQVSRQEDNNRGITFNPHLLLYKLILFNNLSSIYFLQTMTVQDLNYRVAIQSKVHF